LVSHGLFNLGRQNLEDHGANAANVRFQSDCVAKVESCSGPNFGKNLKRKEIDDSQ
jgi:hypothetical protein